MTPTRALAFLALIAGFVAIAAGAALAEYEFHGRALFTFAALAGSWATLVASRIKWVRA